jgi:hypothetical protein
MSWTREFILSLRPPTLISTRPPPKVLYKFHNLGILRRLSTRRGCRAGKLANRDKAAKKFASICLINARSIGNKTTLLSHLIQSEQVDVLAITETWLSADRHDALEDSCPTGFTSLHVPRPNSNGDGVAVIFRSSIEASSLLEHLTPRPKTFEYLSVVLTINSVPIRLVVVYRPPRTTIADSTDVFFSEFCALLEVISSLPGRLLIVGDFNFHLEVASNASARRFLSIIDDFGLEQHVNGATHDHGHLLDLVISRSGENLIRKC